MSYKVQIPDTYDNCPVWWQRLMQSEYFNFLNNYTYRSACANWFKDRNIKIEWNTDEFDCIDYLVFESEQHFILFVLSV